MRPVVAMLLLLLVNTLAPVLATARAQPPRVVEETGVTGYVLRDVPVDTNRLSFFPMQIRRAALPV